MSEMPATLYKYRIWSEPYHQKIITEQQVFLASPANLNDPFDASLPFRYDPAELTEDNIFLKMMEVGKREYPDKTDTELHQMAFQRQSSGVFASGDYWKEVHEETKKNLHTTFGILSLTTKRDNLLMWAHYANCHKGFCIGLDTEMLYQAIGGTLGPVIYDDVFPFIPLFEGDVPALIRHMNTKSKHWGYEDEYRLTKANSANKAWTIPKEAIKEVIIGCNMPVDQQAAICDAVEKHAPGAKILTAHTSLERFELNIYPYTKISY
ncbi:DUF2971 domain-containing protein [Mucilaginibacter sp. Bleaf8]|uniref:DUF2971 domain-containing protein n=1 Tax=Mucilaginibacter sp. Bleaf8 TaxID=2834430 RepID=UPI001BD1938B|nr:DUF2971 domain-containing protein [Mucilaginibacter sp. Bleaf8]MBS7565309.1 DUF2971 domain-containing protein [Mucilaginibacter sp. Bleaf8]